MNHEPARQQVERFVRRFEPSYRRLAYYAALPLVLTPELVHYLRNQFLLKDAVSQDGVIEKGAPWVAEADLLLSDLCSPVGYEQYAIDPAVRAYLLSEMETEIGREQMQAVARLLLSYIRQLSQANPDILQQQDLDNQQMAAMVYLDDQRESVVQRLAVAYAVAYQACAAVGKISTERAQAIQMQLDQLVRITQEMAPQLRDHPELVRYADLLRRLLYEPENVSPVELEKRFAVAPGMELAVPSVLVAGGTPATSGDDLWQTFEYGVVTVAFDEDEVRDDDLNIHAFEFDIATVVMPGRGRKQAGKLAIDQRRGQAWQFVERLTVVPVNSDTLRRQEQERQQWIEMAYLEEQKPSVVRELAAAYQVCATVDESNHDRAQVVLLELERLVNITEELAPQLQNYPQLVEYMDLVRRLLVQPSGVDPAELEQSFTVAPGMELEVPLILVAQAGDLAGSGNTSWRTDAVALEMVAIPAGEFLMGSPADELERYDFEGPQHRVTVPEFYLGKYPITQAQWRVVAGLPQTERSLSLDPSNFKGDARPVEQVSWEEAVEFCARLSQFTGCTYRLPSEAEWEYACRAGTTTPFYYGETIIPDLANYDWDVTYGNSQATQKKDFQGTTPVGTFPANAFGLYDMHGNVWEWCADHWHRNYAGAPTDGSAWLSDEKGSRRLLRGGSWYDYPRICRSAVRNDNAPDVRYNFNGFRVVCVAARTM